ncbi:hypothetical protein IFR05_003182 [Cadophora sp. M221]|nr:hypothetical protein IFR05_003182 [Cadophora sp. M221]
MEALRAPGIPNLAFMAEDRLWERQIRREMQKLLDEVHNIGMKRDKDLDDVRQNGEAAEESNRNILARIERLELEIAEHNQSVDESIEKLQQFQDETEDFLRTRFSNEEVEDVLLAAEVAGRGSSPFSPSPGPAGEPRISTQSPLNNNPTRPTPRIANRKSSYISREASSHPSSSVVANQQVPRPSETTLASNELFKKPEVPTDQFLPSPSMNSRKRSAASRPTEADPPRPSPMMARNRSRSLSREFTAQTPPAPRPPKTPKLSQDRRPMIAYYEDATAIHASLALDGGQPEYDFISAFIKGITNKKIADQLTESLANFCQSDIQEDGTTNILCEWDEVLEGIKNAGLHLVEYGTGNKGKSTAGQASGMPSRNNSRSIGDPYAVEQPYASKSGGSRHSYAVESLVACGERHELLKNSGRSDSSNGRASTSAIHKLDSSNVNIANAPNTRSGRGGPRRTSVEKPGPSKSKAAQKQAVEKGKGGRNTAKKLDANQVRFAENAIGNDGRSGGSANAGGGVEAGREGRGGRKGLPRAAKR